MFLVWPTGALDSDEAIVGLMARHALYDGDLSVFFYGQAYGGTLEALLTVPAIAVGGSHALAVKLVPMVLSALAAVLVWRVGRRTVGERPAVVAALAFWMWPANYVWFSTKARGFYWVAMVLGLAILLLVLRISDRPDGWRDWLLLGGTTGLGWWTTPQILYFVVPAGLWLVWRLRGQSWRAVAALPAAGAGAAPWLLYNLDTGWRSFDVTSRQFDKGYAGNIGVLFENGIPVALGLHAAEEWIVPLIFPVLYIAVLGAVLWAGLRRRGVVALGAVAFPFIWGALPVSGVVGEGRYVLFLAPFVVLLLAGVAAARPATAAAFLMGVAVLSIAGAVAIRDHSSPFLVDDTSGEPQVILMPRDTALLRAAIAHQNITHAYADYWIAYRVTYETAEEVIVAPFNTSRHPPYVAAVAAAPRPAYLYVAGAPAAAQRRADLRAAGTRFDETRAGAFVVIRPLGPPAQDSVMATALIMTSSTGRSPPPVRTFSIRSTTSRPSVT